MNWLQIVRYEPTRQVIDRVRSERILNNDKGLDYLVLNTALECGKKDIANFLLNHNCKVNKARKSVIHHNTPLHNAVLLEDVQLVNVLLEKGALINACNDEHCTPLHLAFLKRNNEIVDRLLTAIGTSSNYENIKNNMGLTTLHIACTRDNTKVIKNLLKSNTVLKDSVSEKSIMWKGFTALHFAAEFKSLEAMKILTSASVSSKLDRKQKNSNGQTALQIIKKQLVDLLVMSDLLSLDTDSNSYNNLSNFHVACAGDDEWMVKKFLVKGTQINTPVNEEIGICSQYAPIHFAIERKSQKNVKILIEQGANLKKTNFEGMTPLHQALYTENGEKSPLVDLLYISTKNKESNPKDDYNLNYLHVACTRNDVDLVKHLLDKNVDVNSQVNYNVKKFYNFTPLHFAVLYQSLEVVRLLIDQGADVNICNGSLTGTPLLLAFSSGNHLLIESLMNNGADPKAVGPIDKETTLHCLVYGYIERKDDELLPYVEKLIMDFNVDVNGRDQHGDTALHVACENLSIAAPVINLLLEFGADINAENDKGETPFMWAMDKKKNRYCDNSADYVMLYDHVQKLKALGPKVSQNNEKCCEQLMTNRAIWKLHGLSDYRLELLKQERLEEVDRMKKFLLIQQYLTLHDFIMLKFEIVATYTNDDVCTEINLKDFPIYGYLIRLQLRKVNLTTLNPEAFIQIDNPVKRQRFED